MPTNLNPVQEIVRIFQVNLSIVKKNDIAENALKLIRNAGNSYAYKNYPKSPYKNLTSNKIPGKSELKWLKDNNKCNQFVGDVLTLSGYAMPTNKMTDGTEHFKSAITLPSQTQYFDKRTKFSDIQKGDVFVKDYERGNGVGHTEIVTDIKQEKGKTIITLAGAHKTGAYTTTMTLDNNYRYNQTKQGWNNGSQSIYFLRPKKPLN